MRRVGDDAKDVQFAAKQCGEFTAIFCCHNCPSVNLY